VAFIPDKVELEIVTLLKLHGRVKVELEIVEDPVILRAVEEATVG
jgi:hypothetical protein